MKFNSARFNIYLVAVAVLLCGCVSDKKKDPEEVVLLRFHLEVTPDQSDDTTPVTVYRNNPLQLTVQKEPFLTEEYVDHAHLVEEPGGAFSMQFKFAWQGTSVLDGVSMENVGRRVAVFCLFGKAPRWLGAPAMRGRISDGVFTFTPDASREEAEKIVKALNKAVEKAKKKDQW
jgi:preprotein translocase subunit SecD